MLLQTTLQHFGWQREKDCEMTSTSHQGSFGTDEFETNSSTEACLVRVARCMAEQHRSVILVCVDQPRQCASSPSEAKMYV